jgi:hypothetical protein
LEGPFEARNGPALLTWRRAKIRQPQGNAQPCCYTPIMAGLQMPHKKQPHQSFIRFPARLRRIEVRAG